MKPLNETYKISIRKRKNSWNNNQFPDKIRILKKSSRQTNQSVNKIPTSKYKKKILKEKSGNEELYFLSNANLNIINILNTCISKDYFNDSSFIANKNSKWKKPTWKNDKNKDSILKKKVKTNIYSNKAQLDSESIINNKNNYYTSIELKPIKEKEKSEGKLVKKKINSRIEKYDNKGMIINNNKFRSKSNKRLNSLKIDNLFSFDSKRNNLSSIKNKNTNIFGKLSQKEIFEINENINKEVNFIQLKKKISKLKKKIEKNYSNKILLKKKNEGSISAYHPSPNNSFCKEKSKINNNKSKINNNESETTYKSNLIKKPTINKEIENKSEEEKHRYLKRIICLYDSIDDEEYNDEIIDYYLSPDSLYIKFIDTLLFISCLFYFTFVPLFLSINYIIFKEAKYCRIILLIIDIIYIIDFINNFFRAYQSYDEYLVRNNKKIIIHYIKTWFLIDLLQAIPYFSLLLFLGNNLKENYYNKQINPLLYILLLIKVMKIYKMLNDNSTISNFLEILSKNETLDDYGDMITTIFLIIFALNLTTCLFIFLGFNSYPNWIFKLNIQDESFIKIYLTSIYFIIVTITTVGYGDITGDSMPEIIFQIFLLIIGTIAYSFIISYFSNYIIKNQQKSMTYEKNIEILREIKLHHPNMKNSTYQEVLRTLHNEQLFERKDKHLLFDCLPYSLKNELIMEMYKPLIQNLNFFKEVYNSDFIIRVTTSLKSLISLKGDVLIQEGDFVKEIIFVKNGVIGLSISFDLDNPEISVKKYFCKNEIGKFDINYRNENMMMKKRYNNTLLRTSLDTVLLNKTNDLASSNIEENISENLEDIKVLEIRKNEHFGDALMFLNDRCPLNVKVRTRTAELFILRKIEAIEIYSIYPNIWKRINQKSLYNMEQINQKIKKIVEDFSIRYNINLGKKLINKSKDNKSLFNNKRQKEFKFLDNNKNELKNKIENKNEKNKDNIEEKKEISSIIKDKKKNVELYFSDDDDLTFKNNDSNDKSSKIDVNNFSKNNNNFNDLNYNKSKANKNKNHSIKTIVQTNSFKLVNNNNNNKNNKISEINKNINFEIGIQKSSFVIKGKSLTINNNSNGSIKANKSNESVDLNDSNKSLGIKNLLTKKSALPNNENIIYNSFINLCTTKENSLQLNSSYENINKISNNKYIDDILLQNKIKQFIFKECMGDISLSKKNNLPFHHSPTHSQGIKFKNEKFNLMKNNLGTKINEEEDKNKNINLLKNFMPRKSITIDKTENNRFKRRASVVLVSNNKLANRFSRFGSFRKSLKFRYSNISIPRRTKRKLSKKKLIKVNKKLYTISKNIESANNAINNPNEFYMNFFNNIIQKDIDKTGDNSKKEKKKSLNSKESFYSLK